MTAAETLAEFATQLRFEDTPAEVIERAKACIIDTFAVGTYSAFVPASRIVAAHVARNSAPGKASVWGTMLRVRAPFAALANATQAHSFEMDSISHPSVGIHPGAALAVPGLAVAEEGGRSGKDLITAFVAGCEVMYRIGDAARESSEKLGFHAPGLAGVFGGAVVAARLMGLDAKHLANAFGIGGSFSAGLLEFSHSGGGMVKCLHLGRAAEAGITAAALAQEGFAGPRGIFDGKFGYLNVYCRGAEPDRLTAGFGTVWHTLKIMLKRYACHITAHIPVTVILELKAKHGLSGEAIESITVTGSEKMLSHHSILEPHDITVAQYSTPFCVALACYRDPRDPTVFSEASLQDPAIRDLCRRVRVEASPELTKNNRLASRVTITLKDGRQLTHEGHDFPGMPQRPLSRDELQDKFFRLTSALPKADATRVFAQLSNLESVSEIGRE